VTSEYHQGLKIEKKIYLILDPKIWRSLDLHLINFTRFDCL
jgi:hypothetical protein